MNETIDAAPDAGTHDTPAAMAGLDQIGESNLAAGLRNGILITGIATALVYTLAKSFGVF